MGKLRLTFTGSFDKKINLSDAHFGDHIPVPETTTLPVDQLLDKLSVWECSAPSDKKELAKPNAKFEESVQGKPSEQ